MSAARDRLRELLRERSFARKQVTLASGRASDFFIDCKQTTLLAEGHALVGEVMLDEVLALSGGTPLAAVAGVELGGCPLASAVALVSWQKGRPIDALYVRKTVKDHGSMKDIEGDTRLREGDRVALLEDVVTTGGSTLRAAERLHKRGLVLCGVVSLVDRLEGGREAIEQAGYPLRSVFTRRDFMGEDARP